MKKGLSVVDQRLYELKCHYLLKSWLALVIPLFVCLVLSTVYVLPLYFNVFWKEFITEKFSFIYTDGQKQVIINILIFAISILVSLIFFFLFYFFSNRKYQKIYYKIFVDELALSEFYECNDEITIDDISLNELYLHLPFSEVIKEHILSLKKDEKFSFHQIHSKNERFKKWGLITLYNDFRKDNFIQISSSFKCQKHPYKDMDLFTFNYNSREFADRIRVESTYKKKTNVLCNKEFLLAFDKLQRFCKSKIIIISFDHYLFMLAPGWSFRFSPSLIKRFKPNSMERKVQSIEKIYNQLCIINNKIIEVGENNGK